LDVIDRALTCPHPLSNLNVYELTREERLEMGIEMLPGSLYEALKAFQSDQVLQDALGNSLTEAFLNSRQTEWETFRTQVTDWEISRYLTAA